MTDNKNIFLIYIIVVAVFFLILFLSIFAPIVVSESDFSIYNPGWNGCSNMAVKTREMGRFTPNIELREDTQTEITQRELLEYEIEPDDAGLMIIGPEEEFSDPSIEFVDDFLQNGGKLVLADDFGSGNTLLEGLDTNSSFHSSPLLDLAFEKKLDFGVAYDFEEHRLTRGVSQVMLNSPTAIEKDANATTVMKSSEASWLDENENGIKDEDELFEQYPLITTEDYGDGELVLVSDPSIFINSMQEMKDNRILSENTLVYLSQGTSEIIFDESHREVGFIYKLIYTGDLPQLVIAALLITTGLGIGVYFGFSETKDTLFEKTRSLWSHFIAEEAEEEPDIGKVLNNHPDWDEDKLKMIKERLIKGDG